MQELVQLPRDKADIQVMQNILDNFKIDARVVCVDYKGIVSQYFLQLLNGTTVKKIENKVLEIALGIKSHSIPTIKPITHLGLISLEVLNKLEYNVNFEKLYSELDNTQYKLPVIVGEKYTEEPLLFDLCKAPHLIVAGTTGSGKSILLHSLICSLIKQKTSVKLVLADPKSVEFFLYKNIKQLWHPIVNSAKEINFVLENLVQEMESRFLLMMKFSTNSIQEYNKKRKPLPYIVAVIDEFADMMYSSDKKFSTLITKLAQKSRACGIHLVLATQRPSSDIINGSIKANFPTAISFKASSALNSRIILDQSGAEVLTGAGDGLFKSPDGDIVRFKGAWLDNELISRIVYTNRKSWFERLQDFIYNVRKRKYLDR